MFPTFPSQLRSPLASEEAAIGAADLLQLRREFPGDGMREVVEMFREEGESLLQQIAGAFARLDGYALRRAAHALHGACGNFGARPLAALCREIEVKACEGDFAAAAPFVEEIREEYNRVEQALQKECPPSP